MSRFLHWFNLAGVLTLAVLCVAQWRVNRQLNLELNTAELARQQQAARLDEQTKRLTGGSADLDGFRTQLTRATAALKQAEAKLAVLEPQVKQLAVERDQLRASVTNWAAAVAARDTQLKQAGADQAQLITARNAAVAQFNEAAQRQNAVVKELESQAKARNALAEELNRRTREFNALVEQHNALAKQLEGKAPGKPGP